MSEVRKIEAATYVHMYIFTVGLHLVNSCFTLFWMFRITDDPELNYYFPFWPKLFTVWTLVMQVIHSFIGIYCDRHKMADKPKKRDKKLERLRNLNNIYFSCCVWPSTWSCSIIFWFFYYYDGNLINGRLLNKVSNALTNHIGHTFPIFTVLWEALFQPRVVPKSHRRNILLSLSTVAVYVSVLWYTYVTSGTWVYPFYDESYGTVYFPLIHVATCLITVAAYYAQWPISRMTDTAKKYN